jgi:L,D-transpeptidase YbiS
MIFAKSESSSSVRNRRSLPGRRRVWPYVLMVLALVGLAAGATFWFLSPDLRLPAISLESVRAFFRSQPEAIPPSSQGAAADKPVAHGKNKSSGKVAAQKKKAVAQTQAAGSEVAPSLESLRADNDNMAQQLRAMAPTGFYVVINTAGNRVTLHNGDKVEAEMIASCGSGNVLEDPKGGRRWTFDTPRGVFTVKTKVVDPVWIKPDWAFIEEGESIPKNRADRAEPGMMGDFAIGIGDGYYLHGTLYSRLLGRNVSHGCVRLGDADIDRLYHTLAKGDRVYIY